MKIRIEGQRVDTPEYQTQESAKLVGEVIENLKRIWPTIQEAIQEVQYKSEHNDATDTYWDAVGVLKSVYSRLTGQPVELEK